MTSLPYEKAQELKDAGFLQHDHYYDDDHIFPCTDTLCVPTLEELIEACPKPIMIHIHENACQAFDDTETYTMNSGEGATPEEAVANLWLALNAK